MRFVVTGGAGYIGSRLIPEILSQFKNSSVILVDNFSAHPQYAQAKNPQIEIIQGDILMLDFDAILGAGDILIHLAGLANPAISLSDPDRLMKVNRDGALRVAEVCARFNIPFLFPSTTSVYSDSPFEDVPLESLVGQTLYSKSKIEAEKGLRDLKNQKKLSYSVIRFGTIFGVSPVMGFHTAVNTFCRQSAQGKAITVWESALHQMRPYLDIEDAVRVVCYLIARGVFAGGTFNAVTVNTTVDEITKYILKSKPQTRIDLVESPLMNHFSYETRASGLSSLGFRFEGDLEKQIAAMLEKIS